MIPTVDCLRETIVQGVAEGQFAYARGSEEKNKFPSIKIGVAIDQSMIEFLEDTCLLRPKFVYELLGAIPPPKKGEPKPTGPEPGEPTTPTKGGPEAYESVSVTSDLDWKKWMEFHDARARVRSSSFLDKRFIHDFDSFNESKYDQDN